MVNDDSQKHFAAILDKVKNIVTLSGLAVLLAGTGLTAVIWNMPNDNRFTTWLGMLGFLLAVVLANMIYAYRMQPREIILGMHVARRENGVEQVCEEAEVTLYRNGILLQELHTNDMGYLTFPVKFEREDNLYVIVVDGVTGKKSPKAALYSAGQFHMIKKIVL